METQPATIGRYQVVRRLGVGGMGSVFLARDPELDRSLAIKLVKDDLTDDPELRERFTREARSAARLRHPNIITVFDIGACEGRPFIAMEYIPGESLADIIRRGDSPDVAQVLRWMECLCAGLAHAHKSGIVHRDIKPGNLMVDPDGILKIVDFGIARLSDSQLTREGMLVGTANYMAPEQLLGTGADFRSDMFAVGAVFYELLTLKRAFPGTIADGLFNRICHEPPPPIGSLCPHLDPEIVRIVDRALDKDPARRYQDLAVMAQHIARVRAGSGTGAPTQPLGETSMATFAPVSTPTPPGVPRPPITPPPTAPSVYDVGARPSGGSPAPGSGSSPAPSAAETESQRKRRADLFMDAAEMAIGQRDFAKASKLLDDAARFDPDSPAMAALRAQIERATTPASQGDEAGQLLAQASARLGQGDFTAARDLVHKILALDPESWDAQSLATRIENGERAAHRAAVRQDEERARARRARMTTLWLVIAIVAIAATAAWVYVASR